MASLVVSSYEYIIEKTEKSNVLYNIKRAILPLLIGTLVLSGLLFSSTVAYFIFYWSYIPSVGIAEDVHLQFSRNSPPRGSVDLASTNMLSAQPYAAFIEIELPRTSNNLEIGNFMVSLSLLNQFNDTLATSSRPTILTYTSPIISTSLTLLNSPLLITGFKKESETLLVPVMERYEFPATRTSRPRWAVVEIIPDGNKIQVYTTKLIFVAQFEGVRWFMYSHRFISFVIFTSLFFISSSLFAGLTWFIFSLHSSSISPTTDHLRDGTVSRPVGEKEEETGHVTSIADDEEVVSPSVISHQPFARHSSSGAISQTYPPITDPSAREEYHRSRKPRFPSESSASGPSKDEDLESIATQIKTDEEITSADGLDNDSETIEGHPVSEVTLK